MYRFIIRSTCSSSGAGVAGRRPLQVVGSLSPLPMPLSRMDGSCSTLLVQQTRTFSAGVKTKIKAVRSLKSPSSPSPPKTSTATTTNTTEKVASRRSVQDARRKSAVRRRRQRQKLKTRRDLSKKAEVAATAAVGQQPSLMIRHSASAVGNLFDHLTSMYPLAKIQDAVRRIQQEEEKLTETSQDNGNLLTMLYRLLYSTTPISGARLALLEFLVASSDPRQTPLPRKIVDLDHVEVLMAARERGLENQLFWCQKDENQASEMPRILREDIVRQKLELHHHVKSERETRAEAQQLVRDLLEILPGKTYRSVMSLFSDYVATSSLEEVDGKRLFSMRKLSGNLEKRATVHFHLIAPLLADFFYMNDGLDYQVVDVDERVEASEKRWEEARTKFVETLLGIQEQVLACIDENPDMIVNSSEEDIMNESERNLSLSPRKQHEERKKDRRFRRPLHMFFEAVPTQAFVAPNVTQRNMVFLDNLPIDISKEELMRLYSRCGDIDSIEIHNKRVDIDPGPLNRTQAEARRKGKLKTPNGRYRKWQRPRTPVYALLTFANEKGHQRALEDPLRVFGVVYQKHPIRSIDASNMTKLYVEDVPEGIPCVDFEYLLCEQLNPDFYVCLDAKQNNQAIVGSCEIKFPCFEAALESFVKLQELDAVKSDDSACIVNWMRTPRDAEKWWTRALGFD